MITFNGKERVVPAKEFEEKILPYFTQICSFLEISKYQSTRSHKNGLVFEMFSYEKARQSLGADAKLILQAVLSKVRMTSKNSSMERSARSSEEMRRQLTWWSSEDRRR